VRRVSVSKTERDARDIDKLMEHKDTKKYTQRRKLCAFVFS
jgi:hypothetical protein